MTARIHAFWGALTRNLVVLLVVALTATPAFATTGKAIDVFWAGLRDYRTDKPLSGGLIYTYTTANVPQAFYLNSACTVAAPNPIVLDQYGRYVTVYANGTYNIVIKTSAGVTLHTINGVEFRSSYAPTSMSLLSLDSTQATVASLTVTQRAEIGSATIDNSIITNSQFTNASMATVDITGATNIDIATITTAKLGTTTFTGGAATVGHIPGTSASFTSNVAIGASATVANGLTVGGNVAVAGQLGVVGNAEVLGDLLFNNRAYNASGLSIIGPSIWNLATPSSAVQASNKGYVDYLSDIHTAQEVAIYAALATQSGQISAIAASATSEGAGLKATAITAINDVETSAMNIATGATQVIDTAGYTNSTTATRTLVIFANVGLSNYITSPSSGVNGDLSFTLDMSDSASFHVTRSVQIPKYSSVLAINTTVTLIGVVSVPPLTAKTIAISATATTAGRVNGTNATSPMGMLKMLVF